MILHPKRLFLIDCLGAILTAFMLGIVLAQFESSFGMPKAILYKLSIVGCFFALYSFICFIKTPKNWKPYLKGIALANLLYCIITLILMLILHQKLTALGFVYFLVEIAVVVGLSSIELKTAA